MTINIEYETSDLLLFDYKSIIERVIYAAMDHERCPYEAQVNVLLTGSDEIKVINNEFRGIDAATDVLSFPMLAFERPADFDFLEAEGADCFDPETGELILGDIVICVPKVREQAEAYGHSEERELGFLTAHSMLHLFGYDHMEDHERKVMEDRQRAVLDSIGLKR